MHKPILVALLVGMPIFAQLESHTVTITASRQIALQPDQVVFGLSVSSAGSASLDQIVAALSGLSITAANLTGVSNSDPKTLQWRFTLAEPLSNLTAAIASLTKLQQTIGRNASGLTLDFGANGLQASPQLRQSQSCSDADLIGDARMQAQKLAQAEGITVGPILRLSNIILQPPSAPDFYFISGSFADFLLGPAPAPVTCALVVEFQLQP